MRICERAKKDKNQAARPSIHAKLAPVTDDDASSEAPQDRPVKETNGTTRRARIKIEQTIREWQTTMRTRPPGDDEDDDSGA
jgi:hypothetical protein